MTNVKKRQNVYCFDTSAFVTLSRTSEHIIKIPTALWDHLEEMMRAGTLISHELVFDEISSSSKNPDFIARWVSDKRGCFLKITPAQVNVLPDIVSKFPGLIDYQREREQVDPWLIALAIERSREPTFFHTGVVIIVSQENPNSSKKIPAACNYFGIAHRSLREFFDEIGLGIAISKNGT